MTDFGEEEIEAITEEFRKKCYHGTDRPVEISRDHAILLLRSRKRHEEYINSVHPSHDLTDWYSEIKCPCNTERFYKTRKCKKCEGEQYYHPAGKFIDPELLEPCVE